MTTMKQGIHRSLTNQDDIVGTGDRSGLTNSKQALFNKTPSNEFDESPSDEFLLDDNELLLSYGARDSEWHIATLDREVLLASLVPVRTERVGVGKGREGEASAEAAGLVVASVAKRVTYASSATTSTGSAAVSSSVPAAAALACAASIAASRAAGGTRSTACGSSE